MLSLICGVALVVELHSGNLDLTLCLLVFACFAWFA